MKGEFGKINSYQSGPSFNHPNTGTVHITFFRPQRHSYKTKVSLVCSPLLLHHQHHSSMVWQESWYLSFLPLLSPKNTIIEQICVYSLTGNHILQNLVSNFNISKQRGSGVEILYSLFSAALSWSLLLNIESINNGYHYNRTKWSQI